MGRIVRVMGNWAGLYPVVFFAVAFSCGFPVHASGFVQKSGGDDSFSPTGPPAVVSGSRESTELGMQVLEDGGNAADAAIVVSLALGIAEPYGSGLGGKIAILYNDSAAGEVFCVDGLGMSPSEWTKVRSYVDLSARKRERSYVAATVPGYVAGLFEMHGRFGRMPWEDLVRRTIPLARDGFVVTGHDERIFSLAKRFLRRNSEAASLYLPGGDIPRAGEILANPDLAATLERLARSGPKDFYRGVTARLLLAAMRRNGGLWSARDLEEYSIRISIPLRLEWRDWEVFSVPSPMTGGATVLLALEALRSLPVEGIAGDAAHLHRLALAMRTVYPVVHRSFGDDPGREKERLRTFSRQGLDDLADSVRSALAEFGPDPRDAPPRGDSEESTSHFVVADGEGNVASITQSLGSRFGAAVVAPGTGFLLNNSMKNFARNSPASPNQIAPSKRPRSTIAPTVIREDGEVVLALGAPAGQRIPSSLVQVLSSVGEYGTTVEEAVLMPRFHIQRPLFRSQSDRLIEIEDSFFPSEAEKLRKKGWQVETRRKGGYYFGGVNAIRFDPAGRVVEVVGDPRRSNSASVWSLR